MATSYVHRGPCAGSLVGPCRSWLAPSSSLRACRSITQQRGLCWTNMARSSKQHSLSRLPHDYLPHGVADKTGKHGRQQQMKVCAGWGAEIEWSRGTIVETSKAAEGLVRLTVDIGQLAKGYTKGGQYLQLKVGDSKPGYFAIASAPSPERPIELLVKNQGSTAEILCDSKPGDEVDVSPVMGKGFSLDRAAPEQAPDLFIFATGTGISPVKALIESGELQTDKRKSVRLYYGTFNPDSTAYRELFAQWEETGVKVINVYSGFGDGYVQHVFEKDGGVSDGEHTAVILCGQKEMAEAITAIVEKKGVKKEFILTNF